MNTYGYVGGNPIIYYDPFGLAICGYGDTTLTCECKTPLAKSQKNCQSAGGVPLFPGMLNENQADDSDCPIPDTTRDRITKGNTDIRSKPGDADTANDDFDNLKPSGVSDKGDGVRVGTLSDGSTVIVRPTSKDGRPTVEIQSGGRTRTKIRYGQ